MTDAHTTRYETFHSKGRWQGLPTKVADGAAPVSFEPVPGLEGAPDDAPDVLIFGVPNTGMMTGQPTNVMLLGYVGDADRRLTLVDTGPNDGFEALSEAFDNAGIDMARVERIVLTHCHPDHVGSASAAQAASGALVFAHPLEQEQVDRFGEGIEVSQWIEDGEMIACDGFALRPILTPGHSPGHVCLVEPRTKALLAGDMMSGFGSVGIFPPNGSVRDYIASLRRLLVEYETTPFAAVCPGHGPVIADARAKIAEYIEHRLQREEEIFAAVGDGHATLDDLVPVIYPDVNDNFARAARGTLIMHLRKLIEDGRVRSVDETTYTVT
ncbi:MAG TPA: MBL fold metallo-hydrolase [Thermomicrobiales bacterium]|nr:MBL fold metallo-hydrolase [Thermomicrobiales bacterium]